MHSADQATLWHALISASGAGVMVVDRSGRIDEANEACAQLFRRTVAEIHGQPLAQVFSEGFAQAWMRRILQCLAEKRQATHAQFLNGVIVRETLYPLDASTGGGAALVVLVRNCMSVDFNALLSTSGTGLARRDALGRLSVLTNRELEILSLVSLGMRTKDMALRLSRSERTLHGHCAAIARKLRLKGRSDMAALASSLGLASVVVEKI